MSDNLDFMPDRPNPLGTRGSARESHTIDPFDPWPSDDPLGETLHFLRMSGAFYGRSELTAPWGLTVPSIPSCLWFHVPTAGECWLEVDGSEPCLLRPGDFALVPHGQGHRLRSERSVHAPSILELEREQVGRRYEILRHGGGGAAMIMICGAVRFEHPAALNFLHLLPRILHIRAAGSPQLGWMHGALRLMAVEARLPRAGGETVITRLADVVVILAIRSWIESDPKARTGWLGALQDREIGRVLALIHRHPERDWTVASLARRVAMSRSAFAARFTDLVGEPPLRYIARWRMNLALSALRDDGASVRQAAERAGYRSEAAFSRAFKRTLGVSPGAARRSGVEEEPIV